MANNRGLRWAVTKVIHISEEEIVWGVMLEEWASKEYIVTTRASEASALAFAVSQADVGHEVLYHASDGVSRTWKVSSVDGRR